MTMRMLPLAMLAASLAIAMPNVASAGCGCDKPPPPRAAVRPFVAPPASTITLFGTFGEGKRYDVVFRPTTTAGEVHVRGRSRATKKDIADGRVRGQLRVKVPELPPGPCRIEVVDLVTNATMVSVSGDAFTVAGEAVTLRDTRTTITKQGYRAAVGADGTLYIPVDLSVVEGATHFWGAALDFPVAFQASNVAMYNEQGYLMQLLDMSTPGLYEIVPGTLFSSTILGYWRHEFRTYNTMHRVQDSFEVPDDVNDSWHADGTRHVDHDHIVIAIRGRLATGLPLVPGATRPFTLRVVAEPEER